MKNFHPKWNEEIQILRKLKEKKSYRNDFSTIIPENRNNIQSQIKKRSYFKTQQSQNGIKKQYKDNDQMFFQVLKQGISIKLRLNKIKYGKQIFINKQRVKKLSTPIINPEELATINIRNQKQVNSCHNLMSKNVQIILPNNQHIGSRMAIKNNFSIKPYSTNKKSIFGIPNVKKIQEQLIDRTGQANRQRRSFSNKNKQQFRLQKQLISTHNQTIEFIENVKKKYKLNFNKNGAFLKNHSRTTKIEHKSQQTKHTSETKVLLKEQDSLFHKILDEVIHLNILFSTNNSALKDIERKIEQNAFQQFIKEQRSNEYTTQRQTDINKVQQHEREIIQQNSLLPPPNLPKTFMKINQRIKDLLF